MAIPLNPKQVVPFEKLLMPQVIQYSPHEVACGERGIHQRRVLGDSEGPGSGDEKEVRRAEAFNSFYGSVFTSYRL